MLRNAYIEIVPPESQAAPIEYSGSLIVRILSDIPSLGPQDQTLQDFAETNNLLSLLQVLQFHGLNETRRLINSLNASEIQQLEFSVQDSLLPPLNSLTAYWRINAREHLDNITEILEELNALTEVDSAFLECTVTQPVVDPSDDLYNPKQRYQNEAEEGIDARCSWLLDGGGGEGIGFVDIEQGWTFSHEDISPHGITNPIFGLNNPAAAAQDHGTATLGVVVGYDHPPGDPACTIVGIAPNVARVNVASHYDGGPDPHVAQAITHAIMTPKIMEPGDVLLLEVQCSGRPIEIDEHNFDAIRLASALGIIVIEPAGNSLVNLDDLLIDGKKILNPSDPDFKESGAVIVSGATHRVPHEPKNYGYGCRVNCFAWGQRIVTAGVGNLTDCTGTTDKYRKNYGGTSGASAIIAGAALLVQSRYAHVTGSRLSPLQMRAILGNTLTGTPHTTLLGRKIGVMPNLKAIFALLNLVPDVYARDYVADTGTVPTTGMVCASPDIIAAQSLFANPNAEYGVGTMYEDSNAFGSVVEAGRDNYIYVRMKNRGSTEANGVTASVYWSETATLITPSMWNPIGVTAPLNVPAGHELRVTDALIWPSAEIPASGHYCFTALLDHPQDPAPLVPPEMDLDEFLKLIKNNNNVVWRNFNVIDSSPGVLAGLVPLPFAMTGAPNAALPFDFEVIQNLPRGSRLVLEVPIDIGFDLVSGLLWPYTVQNGDPRVVRIQLPAQPTLPLKRLILRTAANHACRFLLRPPARRRLIGHEIAIRQMYEGEEVGRVTWHFRPKSKAPVLSI